MTGEQVASIGRIVHVNIGSGVWRPAIVTNVRDARIGNIDATVFMIEEDGAYIQQPVVTLRNSFPGKDVDNWRWPPRV